MVVLVDGDRLARDQTRADAAGARQFLGPVGSEVEPGLPQLGLERRVTEEVDADPLGVGEQKHVVLTGDLPKEVLQPRARRRDHPLGLLAVLAQFRLGHDVGGIGARRVHLVELDTPAPRVRHLRIAPGGPALEGLLDFPDMAVKRHDPLSLPTP